MGVGREFRTAVLVRLGVAGGGVLGGFAGYGVGVARRRAQWAAVAGSVVIAAAVIAVIAWFAWPGGG
jgi:hypothetical protein